MGQMKVKVMEHWKIYEIIIISVETIIKWENKCLKSYMYIAVEEDDQWELKTKGKNQMKHDKGQRVKH